jgi:hypothetical protein
MKRFRNSCLFFKSFHKGEMPGRCNLEESIFKGRCNLEESIFKEQSSASLLLLLDLPIFYFKRHRDQEVPDMPVNMFVGKLFPVPS